MILSFQTGIPHVTQPGIVGSEDQIVLFKPFKTDTCKVIFADLVSVSLDNAIIPAISGSDPVWAVPQNLTSGFPTRSQQKPQKVARCFKLWI